MSVVQALAATGGVFALLAFVLVAVSTSIYDHSAEERLGVAALVSLGVAVVVFLVAIWVGVLS